MSGDNDDDRRRRLASAETPPMGTPATTPNPLPRTATFPPAAWDAEGSVISSTTPAEAGARPTLPPTGGIVSTDPEPTLSEDEARDIVQRRLRTAGVALQPDFAFRHADLVVTLDGFDPARAIGFAYISHADADVVTDFDEASEMAFHELARQGVAFVLVIHDTDIPTADALERRIDAFLDLLASNPLDDTQR